MPRTQRRARPPRTPARFFPEILDKPQLSPDVQTRGVSRASQGLPNTRAFARTPPAPDRHPSHRRVPPHRRGHRRRPEMPAGRRAAAFCTRGSPRPGPQGDSASGAGGGAARGGGPGDAPPAGRAEAAGKAAWGRLRLRAGVLSGRRRRLQDSPRPGRAWPGAPPARGPARRRPHPRPSEGPGRQAWAGRTPRKARVTWGVAGGWAAFRAGGGRQDEEEECGRSGSRGGRGRPRPRQAGGLAKGCRRASGSSGGSGDCP